MASKKVLVLKFDNERKIILPEISCHYYIITKSLHMDSADGNQEKFWIKTIQRKYKLLESCMNNSAIQVVVK